MITFKEFFAEEQSAYEKACNKHRGEMDHLTKNSFEQHWSGGNDPKTGDSRKGVQRGFRGEKSSRAGIDTTHRQSVYWHHNNTNRKNHKVVTHEVTVDDEGTPYSRQSEPHKVEHKTLKAAVTYLNKRKKELAVKKK